MSIRKIGVIGSFAAGAALALAPLAAADDAPEVKPVDFGNTLSSQISSMNWLFETQAKLSGFEGTITKGTEAYPFDTITKDDLLENAAFGKLLYGVNWEDEMGSVPGSFSLFNGALTQFTDGNNVLLYALLSGGEQIDADNYSDYLFGGHASIVAALGGDSVWEDAANFYTNGFNDMLGYFDIDVPSLDA